MRRPNGTGTIVKLKGNCRKPYVVRIPARDKRGRVIQQALSYHTTGAEAQAALDNYNTAHAAGTAPLPDKLAITVAEVYELWSARKYAKAGKASISSYKASWGRLASISNYKIRDVSLDQLQAIIDKDESLGLSKSSMNNDKILMKALYRFAMERDIISKDYAEYVQLPCVEAKHEKGAFTDIQIKQLERMAIAGVPWADTVLMLCYTGFRVTEFLTLTPFSYDRVGDYLRGGVKTDAGKDRIVQSTPN